MNAEKVLISTVRLRSHSGEPISVVWKVECGSELQKPGCICCKGGDTKTIWQKWLHSIKPDWQEICLLYTEQFSAEYPTEAWCSVPGWSWMLKGFKVKILVEKGAQSHFCEARTVPYALCEESRRCTRDNSVLWRRVMGLTQLVCAFVWTLNRPSWTDTQC